MPGKKTKAGRKRKKKRRFSEGYSIVRLRLGLSRSKIFYPSKQIGAIYIPTKWGGTFIVRANRISDRKFPGVQVFYKDGTIGNPPTIQEIRNGTNALGPAKKRFRYTVPEDQMGWFFVVVSGTSKVRIRNEFFQKHILTRRPWNTWYWPGALAKPPHLYDKKGEPTGSLSKYAAKEDGPLEKYDKYKSLTGSSSSRSFEWIKMGRHIAPTSYGGHCDATAWAGFEESRPSGSKTVGPVGKRIKFTEHDRIGLCTERYWVGTNREVDIDEPGSRHHIFRKVGSKLDAAWFHNKLRERIRDGGVGIMVYAPNWNYGIFQYRAVFVAHGVKDNNEKKVEITTRLTYRNWGISGRRKWTGGPNRHFSTEYNLEYENSGTIKPRHLSWARKSVHGKGGSKKTKTIEKVYYKKPSAPIINFKLEKTTLESLYK